MTASLIIPTYNRGEVLCNTIAMALDQTHTDCEVIVVDQTAKSLVSSSLADGRVINLLGGLIRLDYTRNSGAAFSIFRGGGSWVL